MHAFFFGAKRAHFRSVAHIQGMLDKGMTPARFDMLYALRSTHRGDPMWQSELRRALGVSRTAVSRMVRLLFDLALVEQWCDPTNGREKFVSLTYHGWRWVKRTMRRAVGWGMAQLTVMCALAGNGSLATLEECRSFDESLERFRRGLGDVAELVYPWHPADARD